MSIGPRPISLSSDILIHPTIWPQYTNATDRQDRTGQRSDNIGQTVFWATICKTVRPMLSDRCPVYPVCLSCLRLSVMLVYCGQTVGSIKMKPGMEVDLGPSHIVLDGDQAPPPLKRGHSSHYFSADVYCCQTATWIKMPLGTEVSLGPGHMLLNGDPAPSKRGTAGPQFSAHTCCGQAAGQIKMPLGTEADLGPGHIVLDGDAASPKGAQQPLSLFGPCLLWPNGRPSLLLSICSNGRPKIKIIRPLPNSQPSFLYDIAFTFTQTFNYELPQSIQPLIECKVLNLNNF